MISPSKSSLLEGAFQIWVVPNNTVLRRCWPRHAPNKELTDEAMLVLPRTASPLWCSRAKMQKGAFIEPVSGENGAKDATGRFGGGTSA